MEWLFSELKESEDEKIRKDIIAFIKKRDRSGCDYDYDKWIAWLEKQGNVDTVSYEVAENEKREFVGYGFLKCKGDFLSFKEGENYWLEYVGKDNYNVRSDNLLGQTFHITPQQLYTVFRPTTWLEKQGDKSTTLPKWKYKNDNTPLLRDSIILNKYGCVAKSLSGAIISDAWVLDYDELAKLPKEEFENQGEQKPSNVDYYQVGDEVGNPNDWVITTSRDKVEPKFKVGDMVCKKKDNSFCATINSITDTVYLCDVFDSDGDYDDDYAFLISEQDEYELVTKRVELTQSVTKKSDQDAWSEEDEEMTEDLIKGCISAEKAHHFVHTSKEIADWLKSLKDRIGG